MYAAQLPKGFRRRAASSDSSDVGPAVYAHSIQGADHVAENEPGLLQTKAKESWLMLVRNAIGMNTRTGSKDNDSNVS